MRRPRIIEVGLELENISLDFLQKIAILMENTIREYIGSRLGRRLEQLNIIVNTEVNDSLKIIVDVEIYGKSKGRIDYNLLLEEAIEEAYKVVEEELRNVKRNRGENREVEKVDKELSRSNNGDHS